MTSPNPPAALPLYVLDRPDVRAALAAHDFGNLFFLARRWGGISYSRIAESCAIKPERVGKLARGEGNITSYEKIAEIADGMRIPGHLLGLAPRDWESVQPQPFSGASLVTLEGHQVQDWHDDDVKRREFLGAAIAGLTVSFPDLKSGGRLGLSMVNHLRERAARLRRLDDYLGGADTYWLYVKELESTDGLVRKATYNDATRRGLLSVVAEQAQQAGWAAFDAGWHDKAHRLYEISLSAATEAEDRALRGNSLAYLAYQSISTSQPAIETAEASCEGPGQDVPFQVHALLYERLAWAYAVAQRADDAERALELAGAALDRKDETPGPDWASWVDGTELQIMSGRCWTELHRPLRAVPLLERALSDFDDTHSRDKALYSTWLAAAYLDAQEFEQAAAVIGRALDLSSGVASVRPRQRITAVAQRLKPHRALPAIAEVLDRVESDRV